MSNYFSNFNKILYLFGDEPNPVAFQDLSTYVNLIDRYRDDISTYVEYEIKDGERPDTLSHRFYGKSTFDWTFALMNPRIRECGWPLTKDELDYKVKNEWYKKYIWTSYDIEALDYPYPGPGYPFTTPSTPEKMAQVQDDFPEGAAVLANGVDGIVRDNRSTTGQLLISTDGDSDMTSGVIANLDQSINYFGNVVNEYDAVWQYRLKSTGEVIDTLFLTDEDYAAQYIETPLTGDLARFNFSLLESQLEAKTWYDNAIEQNDAAKKIRVIKKDLIQTVAGQFKALTGKT